MINPNEAYFCLFIKGSDETTIFYQSCLNDKTESFVVR